MLTKSFFTAFRFLIWSALAGVIFFLVWQKIVPTGKISFVQDFKRDNYFLGKLAPGERIAATESGTAKMTGNPAYFSLKPPRGFEKAKITLKYRIKNGCSEAGQETIESEEKINCDNGGNLTLPIVEAGILTDQFWHYALKPLRNIILDELIKDWSSVEDKGAILLQREKKYSRLDEFLAKPPTTAEIAVYNYDFTPWFTMPGYAAEKKIASLPAKLQGKYEFFIYLKNDDLNLSFNFLDLNKNINPDPVKIVITGNGRTVASEELPDDGNTSDNGATGQPGPISFRIPRLAEGAYKVEVLAGDDIITESLRTAQRKIAFARLIHIYSANFPLKLTTDSAGIALQTNNPASLSRVPAGKEIIDVSETYRQFEKCLNNKITEITLSKSDTLISGDGMFAFSFEALFNPGVKKITPCFNPNQSGVNYILAGYSEPASSDGWTFASADFELTNAYREKGKYSFMISVPGLKAEDGIDDGLEIAEIRVELEGKSLWKKLREIYGRIF